MKVVTGVGRSNPANWQSAFRYFCARFRIELDSLFQKRKQFFIDKKDLLSVILGSQEAYALQFF